MGLASITNNIITDTSIPSTSVITGTLGTGQVGYGSAANTIAGSNNLFWNAATNKLGINTPTPTQALQVVGNAIATAFGSALFYSTGTDDLTLGTQGGTQAFSIKATTRNVQIYTGVQPGDSGQRLQVYGDAFIKGSGSDSSTTALSVQNSSSTSLLTVRNDGLVTIPSNLTVNGFLTVNRSGGGILTFQSSLFVEDAVGTVGRLLLSNGGSRLIFQSGSTGLNLFAAANNESNTTSQFRVSGRIVNNAHGIQVNVGTQATGAAIVGTFAATGTHGFDSLNNISAGQLSGVRIAETFTPNLPTQSIRYSGFTFESTISQSGGANGITRGVYINPTLTAVDFRAIEWSNNSGWGLYGEGTANNYLGGSLGIGNTSFAGMNLRVSKNITGSSTGRSVYLSGNFQSDVSIGYGIQTSFGTQDATFTLSDLIYFQAAQGTKGASSTIGTQIGFDSVAMTNGGTNIAFRGQNASASNVWNLYMAGTAANYLNGDLRVNQTGATNAMIFASTTGKTNVVGMRVGGDATQTISMGFFSNQTLNSTVSTEYYSFNSSTDIASGTYTIQRHYSYFASSGVKPVGVTITNMYGFFVENTFIQGNNNYGFYGNIASGTGRWNLYMNGTAANYMNGALLLGGTTSNGEQLQVTGTARISGATRISSTLSLGDDVARATILAGSGSNRGIIIQDNAGGTASVATLTVGNSTANNTGKNDLLLNNNFTGGAASAYTKFLLTGTFTESAGGGITRAIYINTTIGTTNNYRAIEWSNNNGWGLYGAGTAANYLGGTLTVNSQITAGNAQATAGSTILRSTYSSGNISNIGTNGSSGGMSINYGAYNASTSTADAYLSGVGTLSFPRSAYAVESDHRWLSAAAAIVAEGSAVTLTEKMRLYNSGNLVIQDGGTYSDAGQRLQVYGDTLMKGTGNTSASTALSVQNSDGTSYMFARNDGRLVMGSASASGARLELYANNINSLSGVSITSLTITAGPTSFPNSNIGIKTSVLGSTTHNLVIGGDWVLNSTASSSSVYAATTFTPTSSTGTFTSFLATPTINQVGATGTTRGLYINPTLTAAADWRSIEWSNNSGWGLYGAGTAASYFAGNVQIGSATAISNNINLQVTGRQYTLHNVTYSGVGVQTFATVKNVTINQTITGGNGINNQVNTGLNIFSSTQTIPETTTYANIFNYNEYRFDAAGVTLFASQSSGGIRTVSQLTTQNIFGGSINGTMSHVSGIQINGYYNNATGSITPTITNAYQLLINDTGEFGHTFSFTNRWGIYQKGINDRNYFAGNMLLNDTNDTGQILQVTGAIRVNGQRTATSGAASGQFLSINCDGTTYKIALLNP
jgi:hypothetical protein